MGGRGLGARLLIEEISPAVDPLSESAKVVLTTGPLTGTMAPGSSRVGVTFKSPLTGIYGFSLAGGHFGAELKYAGFDAVILEGRAKSPKMLVIDDGAATVADAQPYWGMETIETQEAIHRDIGDFEIACIGPAGENLVKYASVLLGRRAAGRCGGGCAFGSKKLKAIAVRGTGSLEMSDIRQFDETIRAILEDLKHDAEMINYRLYGTPSLVETLNQFGILPTRNFQSGIFSGAPDISGEHLREKLVSRDSACFACPVACGKVSSVIYGGKILVDEGPEYETIYALGSNCGISDIRSIALADYMCDAMGMDTMTTGSVIGFLMECREKGLLKGELEGFDLKFGENAKIPQIIKMIAHREAFGAPMAEGVRYLSQIVGEDQFAMHVKGLELGGYDPRGAKGEGLAMATSERGGCHHAGGYPVNAELFFGKVDRFTPQGKGALVKQARKNQLLYDSAIVCVFYGGVVNLERMTKLLRFSTGRDYTPSTLSEIAERISNIERKFNEQIGVKRSDDTLPRRLLETPLTEGASKGHVVELGPMLEDFYREIGWESGEGNAAANSLKGGTENSHRSEA